MLTNKLKEIRMREFMLNIRQFAAFLEISEMYYNRYEKSSNHPTLETAIWIAQKLNRNVTDIWFLISPQPQLENSPPVEVGLLRKEGHPEGGDGVVPVKNQSS